MFSTFSDKFKSWRDWVKEGELFLFFWLICELNCNWFIKLNKWFKATCYVSYCIQCLYCSFLRWQRGRVKTFGTRWGEERNNCSINCWFDRMSVFWDSRQTETFLCVFLCICFIYTTQVQIDNHINTMCNNIFIKWRAYHIPGKIETSLILDIFPR